MSLSSHLKSGPVRGWFGQRFPNTRAVAESTNRTLRGGAFASTPCPLEPASGVDSALAGTAVEYLLILHLRADAWERTTASSGAADLDRRPRLRGRALLAEREVAARARELAPAERELSVGEWSELLRLSVVLARLEQWFRRRDPVWDFVAGPLIEHEPGDIQTLGWVMADETTVADLGRLARVALEDNRALAEAEQLLFGPTFAQSLALGGADADIIADGLLLDLKSTKQSRVVGAPELWQLVGYALADTNDKFGIDSCGIAALRWRSRVTLPSMDLLRDLSGVEQPLTEWRAEFAGLLQALPPRTSRAAITRRHAPTTAAEHA
jgi:hypothetical protein